MSSMMFFCTIFFFKQKTAYGMRIIDWSSDVCSSDLIGLGRLVTGHIEVAVRAERNDHSARVLVRRIDEGPEYGGDPEQTRNRDLEQSVFLEKVGRALQIAVKMPTWSGVADHVGLALAPEGKSHLAYSKKRVWVGPG